MRSKGKRISHAHVTRARVKNAMDYLRLNIRLPKFLPAD